MSAFEEVVDLVDLAVGRSEVDIGENDCAVEKDSFLRGFAHVIGVR